jgi:CHAT domain-containing protein
MRSTITVFSNKQFLILNDFLCLRFALILFFFFLFQSSYSQPVQDTTLANQYYSLAKNFHLNNQFDSSVHYLNKALPIYQLNSKRRNLAECYNQLSRSYFKKSNYNEAMQWAKKALHTASEKLPAYNLEVMRAWSNIGLIYREKSEIDSSSNVFQKILVMFESKLVVSDPDLGLLYSSLSSVYLYKLDYDRSLQYRLKALALFTKMYGTVHKDVGVMHDHLANAYLFMRDYPSALDHLNRAIEIFKKLQGGGKNLLLSSSYNRMGAVYAMAGDFKKALPYLKMAEILNSMENLPFSIMNYRDIGEAYGALGEFKLSISYQNKALVIARNVFGERHPATTSIYSRRAKALQKQGLYDKALLDFQYALISNSRQFGDLHIDALPASNDFIDIEEGLFSCVNKAQVLHERYEREKRIEDMYARLKTYQLLDTILFTTKLSRLTHTDKVRLGVYNTKVYEGAINTCLELYSITKDKAYQIQAFHFSERNKSMIMGEILSEAVIKNSGILPHELVDFEAELKAEITNLQSEIQKIKSSNKKDADVLKEFEDKLFKLNLKSDSIRAKLEHDYPKYYQLKYQSAAIEVGELQKLIPAGTMLLEYFEGDKNIYIFSISSDSYNVRSVSMDKLYDSLLYEFNQSLHPSDVSRIYSETNYNAFIHSAHALFNVLINDVANKSKAIIKNLVIIPDGKLSYLPFEILLMEQPRGKVGDYVSLSYLLKTYSISYGYSAMVHFRKTSNVRDNVSGGLLSFAPHYDVATLDSSQVVSIGKFRAEVSDLKWNRQEVKRIDQVMGGDYYLDEEATESRFKQLSERCSIIHLAMHALTDDDEPMNSKLVFTQNSDSTQDGLLHAFELYNMRLHAQMVVLSACNSGHGKLANGEGMMSLGRAFSYAGVPSVVMSHWKVDDEATSQLMEYFYENLSKGMTKGGAMREAKIIYLEKADPAKNHPFYWAAFITMGNDDPIQIKAKFFTLKIAAGLSLAALMVFGFWYWKTRRRPI